MKGIKREIKNFPCLNFPLYRYISKFQRHISEEFYEAVLKILGRKPKKL